MLLSYARNFSVLTRTKENGRETPAVFANIDTLAGFREGLNNDA